MYPKKLFALSDKRSLHRFYIDIHKHKSTRLQQGIERVTPALEKAMAGEELSLSDGMQLMNEENLFLLGAVADNLRRKNSGNIVTFVCSYYLNYTNICAASCPLCAFYRKGPEGDAYTLSTEQLIARARIAVNELGATELHIVGGFHPKLGLDYYERMIISIKKEFPQLCIKALTPAEIFFISKLTQEFRKGSTEKIERFWAGRITRWWCRNFSRSNKKFDCEGEMFRRGMA